ncbi:MAG: ATP-binding protein [Acidobacteriota bacterium]
MWRERQPGLISDPLTRLTIRGALLIGFVAIFVLWLVWGYYLSLRLTAMERQSATIHARFAQSDEALLTIAVQVLLGSVYLRDAFLDTRPDAEGLYRAEVENARSQIDLALVHYVPDVDATVEREHWTRLRSELQEYWDATMPVLISGPARNPAQALAVLNADVIPKRRTIIEISSQLRTLNKDAFQREVASIALLYRDLRRQIWALSGVALVLGVAVAVGAIRYAGGLESHIRAQHVADMERQRELERLSTQLVHAQEDERRAIARELHDEIGQALTAIKIELSVVQRSLDASGSSPDALAEARSITDRALHAVRDVSQLLHPTMLDDLGLANTLTWYMRGFARRTGIRADLTQDQMDIRMSPHVELGAYRIVQEALTNVAKHAHARTCRVFVQRLAHSLLLTVEDDGVGVDLTRRRTPGDGHRGLGLVGIRERVSGLGGTFQIESRLGNGTRLTAELPLPPDEHAAAAAADLPDRSGASSAVAREHA